jgi:hypothetical protein
MRKIMLIAALALTATAARAEDNRSLSTAPSDAPAATQTRPGQAQSDAPLGAKPADAPRYNAPPAPPPATASTEHPERRYDDRGYFDDAGYHPFPRRYANADRRPDADRYASVDRYAGADRYAKRPHGRAERPRHHVRWTPRRIMAQLRRYGFYW